jgi:ABC-type glycerol-3-phosphate transport system substrate-binding protein
MRLRYLGLLLSLLAVLLIGLPAAAQNTVTISLAVPEFLRETFSADLIAEFEAQNPDIRLKVMSSSGGGFAVSPAYGIDAHLKDMQEYVTSADVVFVNSSSLTPEATRAGYFLDLNPLTSADSTLNIDDFIPEAWRSFQWDRAVWALPVSADVILLVYNRKAFDEAGLAYPNSAWTLEDFANAARALTKRDAEGKVTNPGYIDYGNTKYMLRSLLGMSLVDTTAVSSQPILTNPTLESLLTTWQTLKDDGAVGGVGGGGSIVIVGGGSDGPAMSIQQSFGLASFPGAQGDPPGGSLLPGGKAGLEVQGFAISAGTQYPEQAYKLAKFLTNSVHVANNLFGSTPARKSLAGIEVESNRPFGALTYTPENQAVVDEAFANAMPVSDMLFADYINVAMDIMAQDGVDSRIALQEAEARAVNNLNTAGEWRTTTVITVATPVPDVVLNPGEIALNFGITSFVSPLPNQEQWDQIINEFVANDPQIGQIVLDIARETSLETMAAKYDCFYIPTNGVSNGNLDSVLNLDPYMDADPSFDKNDVVGNTLAQVQSGNKTWAFPIVIQPEVLRYNSEAFRRAGVQTPDGGWTIDAFTDALKSLKDASPDSTPFVPRGIGSDYLLSLIAAFGGLPLDYRATPVTINFTDPATVEAIQQVLDLVKDGYIESTQLVRGGGAVAIFTIADAGETNAITTHSMSALNLFTREEFTGSNPFRLVTYPQGSQYTALAYNVGTAYISANAQNPEACYRWLSTLSRHPELFSAMPARRSLINDPAVTASQTPDTIALFNQIDRLLGQPNVIALPTGFGGSPADMWVQNWLNRAFDRYIREDANLADELAQAEMFAKDYQKCIAAIPALDPAGNQNLREYFQQFADCAARVDPSITS